MEAGSAVEAEAGLEIAAAPQWLVVASGGGWYAVALERVSEIVPPRPYTRLPGCGDVVCGIAGVRGRAVTAFDLGALLGGRRSADFADHRLLLVDYGERRVGLVVDEVRQAAGMALDANAVTPPAALAPGEILGGGRIDGIVVLALNTDRIFERLLA